MLIDLFNKYVELAEKNDPEACGDLVVELDDQICNDLYVLLAKDERTKNKLVKPLWYNYRTQKFRNTNCPIMKKES